MTVIKRYANLNSRSKLAAVQTKGIVTSQPYRCILATETPIKRIDPNGEAFSEVLLMSGFSMRPEARQIPLLDCGKNRSITHVLGSVRNLRIEQRQLVGDLYIKGGKIGDECRGLIDDGHLTAVEMEFDVVSGVRVKRGESYKGHKGPTDLVERWYPIHASIVVHVRQEQAKIVVKPLRKAK